MSEHDGDGGKTGAFLLGFLVGVLVCLGAGGTFFVVGQRQTMMEAERAAHEAMAARDAREAAMQAAEKARAERERADKALKELKAKEKDAKDGPKE
jgi:uncharacterized protein HemX